MALPPMLRIDGPEASLEAVDRAADEALRHDVRTVPHSDAGSAPGPAGAADSPVSWGSTSTAPSTARTRRTATEMSEVSHPGGPEPAREHAGDMSAQLVGPPRVLRAHLTNRRRAELVGTHRAAGPGPGFQ